MPMGFTQTDLDNLKAALVTGAKRVQIGDRIIEYQSRKEIIDTIQLVKAELDGMDVSTTDPSTVIAKFSRGGS